MINDGHESRFRIEGCPGSSFMSIYQFFTKIAISAGTGANFFRLRGPFKDKRGVYGYLTFRMRYDAIRFLSYFFNFR